MATKTIGTGTGLGVTPDYASLNLWDAYMNALGTFTADEIGRVLWASSANELSTGTAQVVQGSTVGSFRIYLEAGDANGNAGGSFRDHANRVNNPLRYNSAAGACLNFTMSGSAHGLQIDDRCTLRNLQLKGVSDGFATLLFQNSSDIIIENSIVQTTKTGGNDGQVMIAGGPSGIVRNCLILASNGTDTDVKGVDNFVSSIQYINCTFANTGTAGTSKALGTSASVLTNCAFYGWATDATNASTGTNCATDKGAAGNLPATNIQLSLVGATEFESVTPGSEDFRLKATSVKCKDQGSATGTATDILGTSRS